MPSEADILEHAKELQRSIGVIHDEILADEVIEEYLLSSLDTLEKILGNGPAFSAFVKHAKAVYRTRKIRKALKRALRFDRGFDAAWGGHHGNTFILNKGRIVNVCIGFLYPHRKDVEKKIEEIRSFLKDYYNESAQGAKAEPVKVVQALADYLAMLQELKQELVRDRDKILASLQNASSVQGVMIHEISHWIDNVHQGWVAGGPSVIARNNLSEGVAHAIEQLRYTYDDSYQFSNGLRQEIEQIIKHANSRIGRVYGIYTVYTAIFIKLFACLVLANAILLKHGDKRAQKMLDECYRTMSLRVLFDSISKGIALVRHWDNGAGFASGIELLLDNAKAQLKSERKVIIDDFHRCMYNWKENNDERPDNLMQAILLAEILAFIGDPEYHHCFKLIKDSLNLHPIEKIVKTHEGYIASLEKRLVSVPKDAAGTRESAKVIGAIRLNRQRIDELQRLIGQQRTAA